MAGRSRISQGKRAKPKIVKDPTHVLQFRIELLGIEPLIWRRIQVPENYTFWDFHVAIQDRLGWINAGLKGVPVAKIVDDTVLPAGNQILVINA